MNVSEAKLLLLRAQDGVQQARRGIGPRHGHGSTRELRSDGRANAARPAHRSGPIDRTGARQPPRNRAPALFARDASYKFADAEKDLSRPTVSAVAVGGFLFRSSMRLPARPIPAEYEGVAANVSIPTLHSSRPSFARRAAKRPCNARSNPISACVTNSNASHAMCASLGPARTTRISASTSPRSSFAVRPRSRWIWRRGPLQPWSVIDRGTVTSAVESHGKPRSRI